MKRTPIAIAASNSAIACTIVEPLTASALRKRPELNSSPWPNPPTAAHSSSANPMISLTVHVMSSNRRPNGPKIPSIVWADAVDSRIAAARDGIQSRWISPRAIRGSRRTRRGSMKVTKNSASISPIRARPPMAATTRSG
jgi:hypothetical protein